MPSRPTTFRLNYIGRRLEVGDAYPSPREVLVVDLTQCSDSGRLPLLQLRRKLPWLPAVVMIGQSQLSSLNSVIACAKSAAARACVLEDQGSESTTWRNALLDVVRLPEELASWTLAVHENCRPRILTAIRALTAAGMSATAADWTGHLGNSSRRSPVRSAARTLCLSSRAVENLFKSAGLPPPMTYARFGQIASTLCIAAKEQVKSLAEAAALGGFSDRSSFSRATHRLLGLRPAKLRGLMGWEYLAYRAGLAEKRS